VCVGAVWLQRVAACCSVLRVCCSVLQLGAVCCSVLRCRGRVRFVCLRNVL